MANIKLTQNAYAAGGYFRLPLPDGNPSVCAMEGSWYEAAAEDETGNEYLVIWDVLDDWDGEDEGDACNWDVPRAVICDGCDVTDVVTIE